MSAGSQPDLVSLECQLAIGGGEDYEQGRLLLRGARRLEPSAGCAGLVYLFSRGRRSSSLSKRCQT